MTDQGLIFKNFILIGTTHIKIWILVYKN